MVQDAVCRNLEIIGEAARRFDDAYRLAHAEIPWRAMTDVRNILIHAYDRVAAEILVNIVLAENAPYRGQQPREPPSSHNGAVIGPRTARPWREK